MNLENRASNTMTEMTLERLSAWMDGELDGAELDQLLAELPSDGEVDCYGCVHSYLSIGEVLRTSATTHSDSLSFLSALHVQLAQEPPLRVMEQPAAGEVVVPAVPSVAVVPPYQEAANQSVFRWKMVAGLASVAAVAMVGWNSLSLLSSQPAGGSAQQVASAAPLAGSSQTAVTPTSSQGLVQMPVTVGQNATIMLRDPRLDELMAARGQIGGTANLQMPASFLRNATFNAEKSAGGCADKTSRLC